MQKVVNLEEVFGSFDERWSPRIIAQVNDYDVKAAHVAGEFVWHEHPDTDEFFLVTAGRLIIDLDDRERPSQVVLGPGELFVVPRAYGTDRSLTKGLVCCCSSRVAPSPPARPTTAQPGFPGPSER